MDSDDWLLRESVASNPSTPLGLLEQLARDANPRVRAKVASNPATNGKLLEALSYDDEDVVVVRVIANPNTTENTLGGLVVGVPDHRSKVWDALTAAVRSPVPRETAFPGADTRIVSTLGRRMRT